MSLKTIAFNEGSVEYHIEGQGPGLVLVHGTGGNAETNWGHLVEELSRYRTVVRPNYSGSGKTTDAGGPLTTQQLAAQVISGARAAGATPFDLIGFSLGAGIATFIAAEYPELVRSVVLLAGFLSGADSRLRVQFHLWSHLIQSDRRSLARLIMLTGFSPDFLSTMSEAEIEQHVDDMVADNNWEGMVRQLELDLSIDVRTQAERIQKRVLVIGATHDHMAPPAHARALANVIPNAQYRELPTGHLAAIEQPAEFLSLVSEFLFKGEKS